MVAEVIPVRWQKGLTDKRGTRQQGNSSLESSGNDIVVPEDSSLGRALGKEGAGEVRPSSHSSCTGEPLSPGGDVSHP